MDSLTFNPYLPPELLIIAGFILMILTCWPLSQFLRIGVWRLLAGLTLLIGLLNPQWQQIKQSALKDIALLIIDDSRSQSLPPRPEQIQRAIQALTQEAVGHSALTLRTIHLSETNPDGLESNLAPTLRHAFSTIAPERYAGAILISDGQVPDLEAVRDILPPERPFHVLLTGQKKEQDRVIQLIDPPHYSLVDIPTTIRFRIQDNGEFNPAVPVKIIDQNGVPYDDIRLEADQKTYALSYTPDHAGAHELLFQSPELKGELTTANNSTRLELNAIREKVRVLFISGFPHQGQRTWRNILKADPAVDLVQFTILRPAHKDDFTPLNELSLISFPVHELFEEKLYDFDLIIFDNYQKQNILGTHYFKNIQRYLELGGAVFVASGPNFAGPDSLAFTPLGPSLPVRPQGIVMDDTPYRIRPTAAGQHHPITAPLTDHSSPSQWGRWLRYIPASLQQGTTLLETEQGQPLLVIDQINKGRIAVLLSDHLWLWARQFDGGGPHQLLIRNTLHWLMRNPVFEANALTLERHDMQTLTLHRRPEQGQTVKIKVKDPKGKEQTLAFSENTPKHTIKTDHAGLYRLIEGDQTRYTLQGPYDIPEFHALRQAPNLIRPIVEQFKGGLYFLDEGMPSLSPTTDGNRFHGPAWFRFKANHSVQFEGVETVALIPLWATVLLGLLFWGMAWRQQ